MAIRTPISKTPRVDVERLRAGVRGRVILPADPGYDAQRAIWTHVNQNIAPAKRR